MKQLKKLKVLIIILLISTSCNYQENSKKLNNDLAFKNDTLLIQKKSEKHDTLNLDNLYKELLKNNIKHPEIVLKQSILETGYFDSEYCKKYNNLFGFRSNKGYIKYDNWKESVSNKDVNKPGYKQFQDKKYKGGDYYLFLTNCKYAEDSTYTQYLKRIHTKYDN